jgi:hypothetical protein
MIIHHRTPLPVLFNNVPVVPAVSARRQKPPTKRNDRDRAGDLRPTRRRIARHENHEPFMQQHGRERE